MRPELLAPAGSPEALRAAVQTGADAVYLGWGALNARGARKIFLMRSSPPPWPTATSGGSGSF